MKKSGIKKYYYQAKEMHKWQNKKWHAYMKMHIYEDA